MLPVQDNSEFQFGLYILFVLLGNGFLLPINAFIAAIDYLSVQFPHKHIEAVLTFVFNPTELICLLFLVQSIKYISFRVRGFVSLSVLFIVMGISSSVPFMFTSGYISSDAAYYTLIVNVIISGIVCAVLETSLFGIAGIFPPIYTEALFFGTGSSALALCLLRLATKAAFSRDTSGVLTSVLVYFAISASFVLLCVVALVVLLRHPGMSGHQADKNNLPSSAAFPNERTPLIKTTADFSARYVSPRRDSCPPDQSVAVRALQRPYAAIVRDVTPYMLVVFVDFVTSFSMFPAFMVRHLDDWQAIYVLTVFNTGDLTGRLSLRWFPKLPRGWLYSLTAVRILLVPAYLYRFEFEFSATVAYVMGLSFVLGWTNGFVGVLGMTEGTEAVPPPDKEPAGHMMAYALIGGLSVGAMLGFVLAILWVT